MSTVYDNAPIAASPRPRDVMAEVASQREIAQVQGQILMARKFPRDVIAAIDRVKNACMRQGLAEVALYEYSRGGTPVVGPSIRMAEAIAQAWGNIRFGIRELEQRPGESTVEAFAWDVETNTEQTKVFQVPHVRHTKKGQYALDDPRDVYEMVANQGARRLRACILGIIPGDVIETAVQQVKETLESKVNVTPEKIASMLAALAEFGVTRTQVEKRIQRRVDTITPAQMLGVGRIVNSLRDGMSSAADWFEPETPTDNGGAPAPATQTEALKERLKATAPPAPVRETPASTGETGAAPAQEAGDDGGDLPFKIDETPADRVKAIAMELSLWAPGKGVNLSGALVAKIGLGNPGIYSLTDLVAVQKIDNTLAALLELRAANQYEAAKKAK